LGRRKLRVNVASVGDAQAAAVNAASVGDAPGSDSKSGQGRVIS